MSVHWLECLAPISALDPARLLEDALAAVGVRVTTRRQPAAGEPCVPGTLRWSHRRLQGGETFLHVSDIDLGLGSQWWDALSALSDGFVAGFEQWEYRRIFDFRLVFGGYPLEQRTFPDWRPGQPDARTLWKERCGLLFDAHATFQEGAALLCEEEWRVESAPANGSPSVLLGARVLLSNLSAGRLHEFASGDLAGWLYRPWTSTVGIPALDLWRPAGLDAVRIGQWVKAADTIAVAWESEGQNWSWHYWAGGDDHRSGTTRDSVELIRELASGTSALGEGPSSLGGRGRDGWLE